MSVSVFVHNIDISSTLYIPAHIWYVIATFVFSRTVIKSLLIVDVFVALFAIFSLSTQFIQHEMFFSPGAATTDSNNDKRRRKFAKKWNEIKWEESKFSR